MARALRCAALRNVDPRRAIHRCRGEYKIRASGRLLGYERCGVMCIARETFSFIREIRFSAVKVKETNGLIRLRVAYEFDVIRSYWAFGWIFFAHFHRSV